MKAVFKETKDRINTMDEHAIWDRKEREYFLKNIKEIQNGK